VGGGFRFALRIPFEAAVFSRGCLKRTLIYGKPAQASVRDLVERHKRNRTLKLERTTRFLWKWAPRGQLNPSAPVFEVRGSNTFDNCGNVPYTKSNSIQTSPFVCLLLMIAGYVGSLSRYIDYGIFCLASAKAM
jgi:hypothetical protein